MSEKWVITAAWPYVNTVPHLGTMLQLLSGDVITRYHKLRKHEVLYVSGSDIHGTPIVVAAEAEGITPKELALKYHKIILQLLKDWNIEFDKYTTTGNETHITFVQEFHKKVHENEYFNLRETEQYFCEYCEKFLPDRFVEGTCPTCGEEGARGDQCTNHECGVILKPVDLINPYCSTCNNTPILRKTEHWYFDLPAFSEELRKFIEENPHIPSFAKKKVLSMINKGLKERPISRDMQWGIPIAPIFGGEFKKKVIYVWFENVLGYISTVKLIAKEQGKTDLFENFWLNKNTKTVFCIGKDNIIFHALLFPAMLMATKDSYPLPHAVATTNFLMFKEGPFSKSKGIGIWGDEAIEIEKADYWRYYLISTRPEMKDTYFDWREFGNAINVDLNDVIGNFIHRTVTFISQHFGGKIPERGKLGDEEEKLLSEIEKSVQDYKNAMDSFKLKEAANATLVLARKGNLYLSTTQPWHLIKKDKAKAGQVLNIAAKIAETVTLLLWPIVPSASEKLWDIIGFKGIPPDTGIDYLDINLTNEGQEVKKSQPIFRKVKVEEVEEKLAELRGRSKKEKIKMEDKRKVKQERISFNEFQKMKLKVATIKHAEEIEKSKNLIKLIVDLGTEERQILAGIKQYYKAEDLIGRQIVVIVNLEPTTLMGEKSDGMLMAADIDGEPILLQAEREVPPGTPIK